MYDLKSHSKQSQNSQTSILYTITYKPKYSTIVYNHRIFTFQC